MCVQEPTFRQEQGKDYTFWCQFNEKPSIVPGCPGTHLHCALCRKIVKDTVDKFGRIDVLVNNASFQGKDVEKFEDITRERLEFTFHSNILAYFSVAQAAVPHIPKGGAIINIASIQGYQPSFGVLDYACTKVPHPLA